MYEFARCSSDPRFPETQGWYLVLKPDDHDTLTLLHKGVARLYFSKFDMDPHLSKSQLPGMCHPLQLASKWLTTVAEQLFRGHTLVVNSKGGWLPLESVEVLSTTTSEAMRWPTVYKKEAITISRWPEGRHYYLSSNKDRIFMPTKYTQYSDALTEAKIYTDMVHSKGC